MSVKPSIHSRPFEIPTTAQTPRQRAIVERIEAGPRGRVPINLRAWLHNPEFVDVVEPFGLYVSQQAPITKRQKEILILVGARRWQAAYEWHAHEGHARNAGIQDHEIQAIRDGVSPGFATATEQLTWELAAALHEGSPINEALYRRCMDTFGHKGVQDLIGLAGLYSMIAMTLNFYDVKPA